MHDQFSLLDQWAQVLIEDSLIPDTQLSTDDFAGTLANQTNLAIKGIVGIKAMSKIAELVGDSTRSLKYSVRSLFSCTLFDSVPDSISVVDRGLVCGEMAELGHGK